MNYMSKEELIKYKEELETKVYKCGLKEMDGPYSLYEIKNDKSSGVVTSIYSYMRNVIMYLSEKEVDYRFLNINLNFKFFYKSSDITRENKLMEGAAPIENLVEVTIGRYEPKSYISTIKTEDEKKFDYYFQSHIVDFYEFKEALEKCGLEFGYQITDFREIKDLDALIEFVKEFRNCPCCVRLNLVKEEKPKQKLKLF